MNQRVVTCPYCKNAMQVMDHHVALEVQCPTCFQLISVQPTAPTAPSTPTSLSPNPLQPKPRVPAPEAPASNKNFLIVIGITAGGIALLFFIGLIVGLYLWTRGSSSEDRAIAAADADPLIQYPEESYDPAPSQRNPYGSYNERQPEPSYRRDAAPSANATKYNLKKGSSYKYKYELSLEVADTRMRIFGHNELKPQGSMSYDSISRKEVQNIDNSATVDVRTETKSFGTYIPEPNFRGTEKLDDNFSLSGNGIASGATEAYLPFIGTRMSEVGLQPLGNGQRNWKQSDRCTMEMPKSNRPESRSPFGSIYRGRFGPRYDPLERYRPKEIVRITFNRTNNYQVIRDTTSELVVKVVTKVTPINTASSGAKIGDMDATGEFTFDKNAGALSSMKLNGHVEVEESNVILKIPVKFTVSRVTSVPSIASSRNSTTPRPSGRSSSRSTPSKPSFPSTSSKPSRPSISRRSSSSRDKKKLASIDHRIVREFTDISWGVKGMAFIDNADEPLLAFASNRELQVYNWKDGSLRGGFKTGSDTNNALATSPNGKYILVGDYKGAIKVFTVGKGAKILEDGAYMGHSTEIKAIKVFADNERVISSERDKRVRVWSLKDKKEAFAIGGFEWQVQAVSVSDDQKTAYASDGRNIYSIDIENGKMKGKLELDDSPSQYDFSPDAALFACRESTRSARIMSINKASTIKEIEVGHFPEGFSFSNNNEILLFGSHGKAYAYHLENDQFCEFEVDDTFGLEKASFTADDKHCAIATGSSGGRVIVVKVPAEGEWWTKEEPKKIENKAGFH